ncbi:MAG: carbamoyltransferase C-terminal domain-containing protein [Candidatus Omnitrophota bacterium]|jgi:carbamoyltransferase
MVILGICGALTHDPSAALMIDGKVVAAADEERFTRKKHAEGQLPINAIRFCLETAGLKPEDIDHVAYPWSTSIYHELKWRVARRILFKRASRAFKVITQERRKNEAALKKLYDTLAQVHIDRSRVKVRLVEHHMAHAASAYYFSGFKESAILSLDGAGELTTCLFAESKNGKIEKLHEIVFSDSLGYFYSTVTAYLGFEIGDGEYKVMGMAPYGDAGKISMSHIIWPHGKDFRVADDYVWPIRTQRYHPDALIPKKMVEEWGLPRTGDSLAEPYIHVAAATQKTFEDIVMHLLENRLQKPLSRTGHLCFAGGCALNVSINRRLIQHPLVKQLWVQPSSHDSGTSLGAAAYVAAQLGDTIAPMEHAYLGPEFTNAQIEPVLKASGFRFEKCADICETASSLLKEGRIVGWFQGRMEWGPRALGNRSILGNPTIRGTNDRINAIIKFRESWRPFCPSMLKEYASDILGSDHPAPFMTFAFDVAPHWKERIPEAVHVDGTCRPQVVDERHNPKFHRLISLFHKKAGVPVVINTSLNRRGEPMICSPEDAILMFRESGLEYLAIGDYLVRKS